MLRLMQLAASRCLYCGAGAYVIVVAAVRVFVVHVASRVEAVALNAILTLGVLVSGVVGVVLVVQFMVIVVGGSVAVTQVNPKGARMKRPGARSGLFFRM